jgi:hypothetical protein
VDACAYKLLEGTGRYVGVEGLEVGVGIELVVVVLTLLADSRDCGRRIPVVIGFWLSLLDPKAGAGIDVVETPERKAVGAVGLESLRLSLSFAFGGDGESSMIKTHPEDSPPALLFLLGPASLLRLESLLRLLEYIELLVDDDDDDEAAIVLVIAMGAGELALGRLVTLPMRNRGTRV